MDINQDQIALILVVAVSVGAFMEGIVKPSLKTGLPVFFRWLPEWVPFVKNYPETEKVKWTFRGIAIISGIAAIPLFFQDASFFQLVSVYGVEDAPRWLDVAVTGVIAGLGEKQAHDFLDFAVDVAGRLKGTPNEPTS